MIIEGLSLARTQKEEFASVIQSNNGDVTKLFDTLNQFISKWLYKINCGRKIKNFKKS